MKSLKYILSFFALLSLFTSCTKDSELLAPAFEVQNNTEKKASDSDDGDTPGKPGSEGDTGEGLASDADDSGTPIDGTDTGISDDDDDESDDDTSTRSK
jgi:hypothetical protein